ncbi:MAG TPA: pyrroloquinoline quinone biosynthesis peptide chaperone PqqD [Stellaceae bacterium]|jgi:pyrroloquinoline quinone biosynthesis protein D|nr:pyrroloquinoline quinone biosynthesis peptide chaperone PqqD [Stellaceae bacterium]
MSAARSRVAGGTVLRFAPHARFRFDAVRQAWVVLAPERLLLPDEQAVAVLRLVDGARDADAIVDALSREYEAPPAAIAADVLPMLQDLVDKKVLVDSGGPGI